MMNQDRPNRQLHAFVRSARGQEGSGEYYNALGFGELTGSLSDRAPRETTPWLGNVELKEEDVPTMFAEPSLTGGH
jgi:hypothetical protein